MQQQFKTTMDVTAATITASAVLGWIPWFAAVITALYGIMCMVIAWPKFVAQLKKWFS